MKGKLVYPYTESLLQYEFGKDHPLKPDRLSLTYLLSEQLGLLDSVRKIEPKVAERSDLERFHTPEYIDAVIKCGKELCYDPLHGLGTADNPIFPDIYDAGARYVGATLDAMKEMMKGASNAFVISGGLHHAHQALASGFCVFNDVVTAIMHLQNERPCRVLYYDFDAHHGDGVQNAFYDSKDVLTISVHQNGKTLFPGSGFVYEIGKDDGIGHSVNIPVLPGASSAELLRSLDEVVVPLFEAYKPDLLVTQLGVDGHFLDPLAQLTYSSHGFEAILKKLMKLSDNICDIGWLAVGGGGYHPVNVARLWSLFLSIIVEKEVPKNLPEDFKHACQNLGYDHFPEGMRDDGEVVQRYFSKEELDLDLDRTIRKIRELVFPYHGIS
ncbi:MAG: acetoin utilization protein AcuC [Candidatus Thorarchaeota archaeon]|jgi:acetoin utilization protein AcuC